MKIRCFISSHFRYVLTFERYFKVREYQNRMQHGKIPLGSYPKIFSPGGLPGGTPPGGPIWRKSLRIRPREYFFMLRSILIHPDLEIPLKSQKIMKTRIYKKSIFSNFDNHDLRLRICMIFHADSESDLKISPNQVKNQIL